jgi:hypothetical protein
MVTNQKEYGSMPCKGHVQEPYSFFAGIHQCAAAHQRAAAINVLRGSDALCRH